LKEKIGKFMERKECNAEGKTSACILFFAVLVQK
jgi:hypothetical protein